MLVSAGSLLPLPHRNEKFPKFVKQELYLPGLIWSDLTYTKGRWVTVPCLPGGKASTLFLELKGLSLTLGILSCLDLFF